MILSLDLSTNSTGYALINEGKIVKWGILTPSVPRLSKLKGSEANIKKCESICYQLSKIVDEYLPSKILIEQVNMYGVAGVIQQKNLCILHGLLEFIFIDKINTIEYIYSSEWRKKLGLSLKKELKLHYAKKRKLDKKLPSDYKLMAVDYCNNLGYNFEYKDHDICDAICIGLSYGV